MQGQWNMDLKMSFEVTIIYTFISLFVSRWKIVEENVGEVEENWEDRGWNLPKTQCNQIKKNTKQNDVQIWIEK